MRGNNAGRHAVSERSGEAARRAKMKKAPLLCITPVMGFGVLQAAAPDSPSGLPQYNGDNQLLRPEGYREWIYLSSGLGMNYRPAASGDAMFNDVFVPTGSYQNLL